ncbi:MAG: hypothetical protein ACP5VS_10995, partial [Desulfomonilaceae bacterium]
RKNFVPKKTRRKKLRKRKNSPLLEGLKRICLLKNRSSKEIDERFFRLRRSLNFTGVNLIRSTRTILTRLLD